MAQEILFIEPAETYPYRLVLVCPLGKPHCGEECENFRGIRKFPLAIICLSKGCKSENDFGAGGRV